MATSLKDQMAAANVSSRRIVRGMSAFDEDVRTLDYIAATDRNPVDFHEELRATRHGKRTRIATAITMYNEDSAELERTLE